MRFSSKVGFIGLGQMGFPMAMNLSKGLNQLSVFDIVQPQNSLPENCKWMSAIEELAATSETIFLSLPDGKVCRDVIETLVKCSTSHAKVIIDLSTIGPQAAQELSTVCTEANITYIDAPVSGGAAGAKNASITIMWAGSKPEFDRHQDILSSFSKNQFHVGDHPGQGQALKILNNFLSATAMAATSEAVSFGLANGLEMKTLLDVVNVSTGRNSATQDKFPQQVLTEKFAAGFKTALMAKDVRLYLEESNQQGTPNDIATLVSKIWTDCEQDLPASDFTEIYRFIGNPEGD